MGNHTKKFRKNKVKFWFYNFEINPYTKLLNN